jgi:LuxR family maltose regulon positive regulatory protein
LIRITQARAWIAQKEFDEAIQTLSCLEESALAGGRRGRLIEILLVKALALLAIRRKDQAGETLTKSLTLAQAEGYVRIFLDEGRPMRQLLAHWLAHAGPGPIRDYAAHLLFHFEAEPHANPTGHQKVSLAGDLVEPLSQRELEVLGLMALGRTNQQIARQLIVAPGTVKAHTASIYRKLEAANRTEAVARARQLGILP